MARLHHIHLRGNDPRRTAQWYIDNLGARLVDESKQPGGVSMVRIDLDGTRISISSPASGQTLPAGSADLHLGLEHFGLEVDDLSAALQRLQQAGAEVLEPVREVASGAKIAFIRAPDNVRIEMLQLPS